VADPFFLDVEPGQRFCLFHRASPQARYRGAILYLHPFAEELNKSRRMAAIQSRAFAAAGFDVLQIDLFGCGDSDGDLVDARWTLWLRDATAARAWLGRQGRGPFYLWGLRLGALLALELAAQMRPAAILLWHPELDGNAHMRHVMRLRLATGITSAAAPSVAGEQEHTEIGGYALSAALVRDIGQRALRHITLPPCPMHCYWISPGGAPARAGLAPAAWQAHGVQGQAFWTTGEIAECPALIAASTRALAA
jgi:exosortase A-associated hydrolase 2